MRLEGTKHLERSPALVVRKCYQSHLLAHPINLPQSQGQKTLQKRRCDDSCDEEEKRDSLGETERQHLADPTEEERDQEGSSPRG